MKELDYNRLLRIQETIVDITANCYTPLIIKYEDSRLVVETIKAWADEFEDWWDGLSDDDRDRIDYLGAIDDFSERHIRAEFECDDPPMVERVLSRHFHGGDFKGNLYELLNDLDALDAFRGGVWGPDDLMDNLYPDR